jgi:hypothetical protein
MGSSGSCLLSVPDCIIVHVRHSRLFVHANCGVSVVLSAINSKIYLYLKPLSNKIARTVTDVTHQSRILPRIVSYTGYRLEL